MKFTDYLENLTEKNGSSRNILIKIRSGDIPLSPKVLESIFDIKKETYFHVTDITNIKKLQKLQHSRKTVSCFNEWGDSDIFFGAMGIEYEYPCTTVLNGSYTFKMQTDFFTDPDSQGRRWIQWYEINDQELYGVFEEISEKITECFLASSFGKNFTGPELDTLLNNATNLDGKTKAVIIKTYLDCTENILKKYKNKLQRYFLADSIYDYSYNEVLGYNFEIKEIKMDILFFSNYLANEVLRNNNELKLKIFVTDDEMRIWTPDNSWDLDDDRFNDIKERVIKTAESGNIKLYDDLEDMDKALKRIIKSNNY